MCLLLPLINLTSLLNIYLKCTSCIAQRYSNLSLSVEPVIDGDKDEWSDSDMWDGMYVCVVWGVPDFMAPPCCLLTQLACHISVFLWHLHNLHYIKVHLITHPPVISRRCHTHSSSHLSFDPLSSAGYTLVCVPLVSRSQTFDDQHRLWSTLMLFLANMKW